MLVHAATGTDVSFVTLDKSDLRRRLAPCARQAQRVLSTTRPLTGPEDMVPELDVERVRKWVHEKTPAEYRDERRVASTSDYVDSPPSKAAVERALRP